MIFLGEEGILSRYKSACMMIILADFEMRALILDIKCYFFEYTFNK